MSDYHNFAFLQAIKENPNDNAPRLIYADWLEERGDPKGEFIRLQVLAASTPRLKGRGTLEDHAKSLLDKHRAEWEEPFKIRVRFDRGMPVIGAEIEAFLRGRLKIGLCIS